MAASINKDACVACGACAGDCPCGAITVNDAAEVNEELCVSCGACADSCPAGAITVE